VEKKVSQSKVLGKNKKKGSAADERKKNVERPARGKNWKGRVFPRGKVRGIERGEEVATLAGKCSRGGGRGLHLGREARRKGGN